MPDWGMRVEFEEKDSGQFIKKLVPMSQGINNLETLATKRKELEKKKKIDFQLLQANKMEALGALAGGIAHDFNNLLMGIQGYASLMLLNIDSRHPHYEKLKKIEEQVNTGATITKQLLGFARGGKYDVRPADMNELAKKTSTRFGQGKEEIKIEGRYQKDIWSVEIDQGQIHQVMFSLYSNAWQAMPGGGELYLETENVTLDEDYCRPYSVEPGNYVKISFTDTGVGMDETTRQKIFEPFFTTKKMHRGAGLGLASVYGIINNHDGIINVYSEKGHGTTINIYLPASVKEIEREEALADEVLSGTKTILLVDDEEMIIDIGVEILESLGYKVLSAKNGTEAIEIVEKAHKAKSKDQEGNEHGSQICMKSIPDLVILDMIMPDMSGGETYDKIKDINPDIKVLLSSGYSINGQANKIMQRGCNGFIQKPFSIKALSKKIREILDEKSHADLGLAQK